MITSQKTAIKRHLETEGSLSQIQALKKYGCGRLASRIHELRTDDHLDIQTRLIKNRKKGGNFAEYYLNA